MVVTCSTCHVDYDETDEAEVRRHTDPIQECDCSRCRGKPSCYLCGSSFCLCGAH